MPALTGFASSTPTAKPAESLFGQPKVQQAAQGSALQTESKQDSRSQHAGDVEPTTSTSPSFLEPQVVKPMPGVFTMDWKPAQEIPGHLDEWQKEIWQLSAVMHSLNIAFRAKINNAELVADWSKLSSWHYDISSRISAKITDLRKTRAASLGVTGHESSLSVKRKADDQPAEASHGSATPSKKQREIGRAHV